MEAITSMKIVVVGDSYVGKTTLVEEYTKVSIQVLINLAQISEYFLTGLSYAFGPLSGYGWR